MVKDCACWNPSPSAVTVALQVHSLHTHTLLAWHISKSLGCTGHIGFNLKLLRSVIG